MTIDTKNRGRWFLSLLRNAIEGMTPQPTIDGRPLKIYPSQIHAIDAKDFPYVYVIFTDSTHERKGTSQRLQVGSEQQFLIVFGARSGRVEQPVLDDLHSDVADAVESVFDTGALDGLQQQFTRRDGSKYVVAITQVVAPTETSRVLIDREGVGEIGIVGKILFNQSPYAQ